MKEERLASLDDMNIQHSQAQIDSALEGMIPEDEVQTQIDAAVDAAAVGCDARVGSDIGRQWIAEREVKAGRATEVGTKTWSVNL